MASTRRKSCRCLKHNDWKEIKGRIFNIKTGHGVKKAVIDYLRAEGSITTNDAFLCSGCANVVEKLLDINTTGRKENVGASTFPKNKFLESCFQFIQLGKNIRRADYDDDIKKALGNFKS